MAESLVYCSGVSDSALCAADTTDDYKKYADSNAFLNKIQYPSRGAIYDRTGKLLVFNQPAYDISVVPKEIENLDTLDLCESLNITRAAVSENNE